MSQSVRVRSRTSTDQQQLLTDLVQLDKGSLQSFKTALLTQLERNDRRLFNLELPPLPERRPSVALSRGAVSHRALSPPPPSSLSGPSTVPVPSPSVVADVSSISVPRVVAAPAAADVSEGLPPSPSPAPAMVDDVVLPEDEVDLLRDMWGVAIPEQHEEQFMAWYEAFVSTVHLSQRAAQLLLDSLEEDVDHRTTRWFLCTRDPSHDMRYLARNGIAPNWRGRVYSLLLDLEARSRVSGHDFFADFSKTVTLELASIDTLKGPLRLMYDQIDRDVPRTFPDVVPFHPQFLEKLALVLRVYSRSNGHMYTQGINFICGSLLFFFEPPQAFLMLKLFCEELLPFYFSDGMIGLLSDTRLFELIVEEQLPKLWAHFKRINLSMLLITSGWFTCLFCKNFPLETTFRVWDLVLLDGGIARMFEFALRTLALFEPKLLQINDDVDLVCALNVMVESLYDFDKLLKVKLAHPLVSSNVQLARVRLRRELLRETTNPPPKKTNK